MLLAMPVLMASPEMKQAAIEDVPQKKVTYYGREYTERRYFTYLNCQVQDGILKVAFYMPDCLRLNGDQPVYEVFLDKKNRQFLTYDCLARKWRDAKLDRLEWPGRSMLRNAGSVKRTPLSFKTIFQENVVGIMVSSTFKGKCARNN